MNRAERSVLDKTVLLVEDSSDDILLLEHACRRCGVLHNLRFVMDGQAAIDYLAGSNGYADRQAHPLPRLILLDVKLPKRNGHEVLQWIRDQPAFRNLPVIMLTGSRENADIERAYQLGVTSYLQKNADVRDLDLAVAIVLKYWLEVNIPATY